MFIETQTTPNPDSLKFLPGQILLQEDSYEFTSEAEAQISPLANRLFAIKGIIRVFFGYDFITITKDKVEWAHIKPEILSVIMEHFTYEMPLFIAKRKEPAPAPLPDYDPKDELIVKTIKQLLEERVKPAIAHDGGDVEFCAYKDGIVYLYMKGACAGCPAAGATLKYGIENLLRHFIPDIKEVKQWDYAADC